MAASNHEKLYRALAKADCRDLVCSTVILAKRCLAADPARGAAWMRSGIALSQLARYPEALAAFRHAARLAPPVHLYLVQINIGDLYRKKGQFRRAETWFRKAAETAPEHATPYIYLGGLLAKAGRLSEAEAVHRKATLCKDGCIDEAFLNLGLVLRAQEKFAEALACFREALRLDPKYKEARHEIVDLEYVLTLTSQS